MRILRTASQTKKPTGILQLAIQDEHGRTTAARVGFYDGTGQFPIPSDGALPMQAFNGLARAISQAALVGPPGVAATTWPVSNPTVMYVDGSYRARLPVGDYTILLAKGPEYRITRQQVRVRENAVSALEIKARR